MQTLGRNGISAAAVSNALHGKTGRRNIRFRYDLIRNGVSAGTLPVLSASVRYSAHDDIQRTARFEMADDERINWLTDLIRPSMLIEADGGWASFPLGVFVPSTPTKQSGSKITWQVEAYDRTIYLREDSLISRTYWPTGTAYLDVVQSLLLSAGISDVISGGSLAALPTDREWDIGTSKLEIVNTLLSEINYNPLSINSEGAALLLPYQEPSADRVTYSYRADELSVLSRDASSVTDLYNVPNIFLAVVSNPEMEPLQSVYINDNPTSELSTVRRGRNIVSQLYKPDAIYSQEALDEYIRRIAFEASQVYETASIETALMPIHEANEILEIRHPEVNGVFEETGWEMELSPGGKMTHEVRRIVQI